MSKVISCWSNKGHQTGVTTHTALLAYMFAKEYKDKTVLALDMSVNYSELELLLNSKHEKGLDFDSLKNKLTSKKLDKAVFCENCAMVEKNFYNLNAASNTLFDTLNSKENIKKCLQLIDVAAEIFDIVIIDNQAGYSELSNAVNNRADVILNFVKQNPLRLEKISEAYREKIINIINEYSDKKMITPKELEKEYDLKEAYMLNYCEEIVSFGNRKALKAILNETETAKAYLLQFKELFDFLAEKVELKQPTEKKKGIFTKFFRKGERK